MRTIGGHRARNGVRAPLSELSCAMEATVDLTVTRQVDQTVDAMVAECRALRPVARLARLLEAAIGDLKPKKDGYIDPDDQAIDAIKRAYQLLEARIPQLVVKEQAIDRDGRLNENHCELLHSAYQDLIAACSEFVEAAKDLRAAVIRHDLAAEPRDSVPVFSSLRDLLSNLRKPRPA